MRIKQNKKEKKTKLRLKKSVLRKLIIIIMIFIGYISFRIVSNFINNNGDSIEILNDIKDKAVTGNNLEKKIELLYKHNKDLVGYIIIPGTNINYPVMYTEGEDYYLRRNINKEYSINGSLFIDKYNKIIPRDTNILIHGHNMKSNKTMFYELSEYKEESFYENHKYITYYFINNKEKFIKEKYVIVAVFLSKVYNKSDDVFKYYKFYNAKDESSMNDFNSNIKELSIYDTGLNVSYEDKLITLSTCDDYEENGRLVVVAKKVDVNYGE